MAKKHNDTGIPQYEIEALARSLLPEIQKFFESEEGQREFTEWKAKQRIDVNFKRKQDKSQFIRLQSGGITK
jgi:hypothetical protein